MRKTNSRELAVLYRTVAFEEKMHTAGMSAMAASRGPAAIRRGTVGHTGSSLVDPRNSTRMTGEEAGQQPAVMDLRGWLDDHWRVAVRRPVRCPVWPEGGHDRRPDKDMRASESMPAMPRVPWPRADQEQCRQHPDDPSPRLPLARCLVPVAHRDHLPHITIVVLCEMPHPATR
jgi:hypothetical protein